MVIAQIFQQSVNVFLLHLHRGILKCMCSTMHIHYHCLYWLFRATRRYVLRTGSRISY